MQYKKKLHTDPDVDQLNPQLVKLAKNNAFLRGPFELFLTGELTWREALETMLLLITKEYNAQGNILVSLIEEKPQYGLMITDAPSKVIKALPQRPLSRSP
jgi:hypothetical protein